MTAARQASWKPPEAALVRAIAGFSAATLHEAGGKPLPSSIKPIVAAWRVCGPAVTVRTAPGDNLWLHRALAFAGAGDVLVVDVGGRAEAGYWGEIMTVAALARGLAGLVIDGCVRDGERLARAGFPVFACGLCVRGTTKAPRARGFINREVRIGDVVVAPGDLVRGDRDGVVSVPRGRLARVVAAAKAREAKEARIKAGLRAGRTTLEIYGWDRS